MQGTAAEPLRRSKIGLALAGGGPEGAIYEIGALRALDEALEGFESTRVDSYVGVSAGAFIAGCVANGMTSAQLCRAIVKHEPGQHPFRPWIFFTPALREFAQRSLMTPRLLLEALWSYASHPLDQTLLESLFRMARALPVGVFDSEPVRNYLERIFNMKGRTDDFRKLNQRLVVVAADLDSGEAVRFGEPGFDHVPISRAIQASCSLPGLYPPVTIDGRHYVDGVLLKTLHGSVALADGVDLLICINPIVPVDTAGAVNAGAMRRGRLVHRGLPAVLSQTLRTLVRSRLAAGLTSYAPRYPDRDVLLIEPPRDDYRMFFTNVFSFSERRTVCEHAYRATQRYLLENRAEIEPLLARHGIRLRTDRLESDPAELWSDRGAAGPLRGDALSGRLDAALTRLERILGESPERLGG